MELDILIRNGLVLDGCGTPPYEGDVGIRGDRVVAVGALTGDGRAGVVVDAGGKVICPGFIDLHTHSNGGCLMEAFIRQGVTSVIGGNCGFSMSQSARSTDAEDRNGVNTGRLVGHNSVRLQVMGNERRDPTSGEMRAMRRCVAEAMEAGAVGFSTGLAYVPGQYCGTEEIIELAREAARFGGYYTSHIRSEGDEQEAAIEEALRIGTESGLPVHISHIKSSGVENHGRSHAILERLARARASGQRVTADQYPYTASSGSLRLLMPAWALEGTESCMAERLAVPEVSEKARAFVATALRRRFGGDGGKVAFAVCGQEPDLQGKTLTDLALRTGREPSAEGIGEAVVERFAADPSHQGNFMVYHSMSEGDVETYMRSPYISICSDAWEVPFGEGAVHPRHYGPWARVLGRYCRERKLFPLEEAVRKMTSLPAGIAGLRGRGRLVPGGFADVVVFDPDTILDRATFDAPHRYAVGVDHVLINGVHMLNAGELRSGCMPGQILLRDA